MRTIAGMCAVIILSLSAVSGQDTAGAATGEIDKAIVAREQALYQAIAKQDKASFQALVIGDGTWTTSSGFVPMRLLADGLDAFDITKFGIDNPRVTPLGADSALVVYARRGDGTFAGQRLAPAALASTVWVKRDGRWRALHHQETDLAK